MNVNFEQILRLTHSHEKKLENTSFWYTNALFADDSCTRVFNTIYDVDDVVRMQMKNVEQHVHIVTVHKPYIIIV